MGFNKGNNLWKEFGFKNGNVPWNKGKKMSKSFKDKRKEIYERPNFGMRGKHFSEESKIKIGNANRGKRRTEEQKKNLSLLFKKIPHTKEWNKKVSLALKGKKKTIKNKENSRKAKAFMVGKSFEEIFGDKKAMEIKEKIGKKLRLENNPRWLGGKSFEPYGLDFNINLKNEIRKRDNQVCMLCGIHREKLKEALAIHHINYNKELNISQNVICLCRVCHSKTNSNREHWTTFFQSLLSERYGYNYSNQGQAIINLNVGGSNGKIL